MATKSKIKKSISEICYYNPNFLYVESGAASQGDIELSFKKAIKEVSARLSRRFSEKIKVNVVCNRMGEKFGYSYIWVEDEAIYHMLLGNNLDGTPRVQYYDQPGWICPPREDEDLTTWENLCRDANKSWVEIMEEEEEIEKKYRCPQIKKVLPPLMTLPSFNYSEDQKRELKQMKETTNKSVTGGFEIPSQCVLVPGRAYVNDLNENYCHNILCSRSVPLEITEDMIKEKFKIYATDPNSLHKRRINGSIVEDTYPYVTINNRRLAFVTFDYHTRDASFARLMNRKLEFTINFKTYTIIFEHSFQTNTN